MATRKLLSNKDTLLGTITFPDHWLDIAGRNGGHSVHFHIMESFSLRAVENYNDCQLETKVGTIVFGYSYAHRDAVHLYGVTPEQFEQVPGCSFAPSAAYLRSLLEG